jgi:hypothetical protein
VFLLEEVVVDDIDGKLITFFITFAVPNEEDEDDVVKLVDEIASF